MDKVIETLEEMTQITSIMPETRFQMALTMAITDLNRARQLEAECAAMRKALEEARDLYECAYHVGVYSHMGYTERREKWNSEAKEILTNMQQALSSSAGKDLLEKVQRLESVAEAAQEVLQKEPTIICPRCDGSAGVERCVCEPWELLRQTVVEFKRVEGGK